MGTIKVSTLFGMFTLLVGCAGNPTASTGERTLSAEPMRYPAWLQGDIQSAYQMDSRKTAERLKEVEEKKPGFEQADLYLEYCSLLDASGRSKEAEARLKAFLEQNPKETRAQFLLASHYLKQKKEEIALYLFQRLEKDPQFPWKSLLYNNLGMAALSEGDRRRAIDYFQRATKSSPPIAAPYVNLGALYLQSLSYGDAEKVFSQAVRIDKDFEDAFVGLGSALEGLGKFEEAHRAYTDFHSDHSEALTALYNDAILLGNRLNRRADASQLMLRYVQQGGKASARAQELMRKWR